MSDWKSTKYEPPKKWGEGKDWLEKAAEPSDGGKVAVWIIGLLLLGVASVALIVSGLFF